MDPVLEDASPFYRFSSTCLSCTLHCTYITAPLERLQICGDVTKEYLGDEQLGTSEISDLHATVCAKQRWEHFDPTLRRTLVR